jgi:CheY-like chemotaxis protein
MSAPRILLVDDQRDILKLLHSTLDTMEHELEIYEAPSGEEAMLEALREKVDLLVSDYRLPGMTGVELMHKVRAKYPNVHVILITGLSDKRARDEILNAGAAAVFDKPISLKDFLDAVERTLGLSRTVMPEDDSVDVSQQHTLSNLLANFRQDIDAQAVFLINDRGHVVARAGNLKDSSMEVSLLSALMAIYSAGLRVSRLIRQPELDNYHVFTGGDNDVMLIPINAGYALMLAGDGLATTETVLETVEAMLAVRAEVVQALKSMGVAPVVMDDDAESEVIEEPAEPVDEKTANEFDKLLKSKKEMSSDELDDFWDSAVQGQTSVPSSPDAITFEQAQQLGFKPGEEEI